MEHKYVVFYYIQLIFRANYPFMVILRSNSQILAFLCTNFHPQKSPHVSFALLPTKDLLIQIFMLLAVKVFTTRTLLIMLKFGLILGLISPKILTFSGLRHKHRTKFISVYLKMSQSEHTSNVCRQPMPKPLYSFLNTTGCLTFVA